MSPTHDLPEDDWLDLVREALAIGEAPPQALHHALELWRTHGPRRREEGALRRWVAVLSADSWAMPQQALGLRAAPSDVRHMLFTADDRDVDIRIAPQAEGFALSGQHLGPDAGGHVELSWVAGGTPATSPLDSALDDMGEFRFDGVAPGTYLLTVRIGGDEIVLPPFDVGSPADGPGA
jgi:hypothetical protein